MPLSVWVDVFDVIINKKVQKQPQRHGGSWRANAVECVDFGGKCFALWRHTPLVVGANARGARNIFSRCLNLPLVMGDPPTPHPHPSKIPYIQNFGAKIEICDGADIQIYGAKIQTYSAKTQVCGPKIQIFDPKFKYMNFCTAKNLPLCTRKTPGAAGLTHTHPPIGVRKNLE